MKKRDLASIFGTVVQFMLFIMGGVFLLATALACLIYAPVPSMLGLTFGLLVILVWLWFERDQEQ